MFSRFIILLVPELLNLFYFQFLASAVEVRWWCPVHEKNPRHSFLGFNNNSKFILTENSLISRTLSPCCSWCRWTEVVCQCVGKYYASWEDLKWMEYCVCVCACVCVRVCVCVRTIYYFVMNILRKLLLKRLRIPLNNLFSISIKYI